MAEPNFDVAAADRWFAIESNNETWNWLYANSTGDSDDPIVHAAHASLYHWQRVGGTINAARAASLVANVHSALGHGELALTMARLCIRMTEQAGDEAEDWDIAFAQDSLARAFAATGDTGADEQRKIARRAGDTISDPADREVFDEWFYLHR